MKVREHRRLLAEAMETVFEASTRAELVAHIATELGKWGIDVTDDMVQVKPYCSDKRIGWLDTHIITIDGYGVFGFTDGPCPASEATIFCSSTA